MLSHLWNTSTLLNALLPHPDHDGPTPSASSTDAAAPPTSHQNPFPSAAETPGAAFHGGAAHANSRKLVGPHGPTSFLEFAKPFFNANASNTYEDGKNPQFSAKRALDPGGGYWVSDGTHGPEEVVSYEAHLRHRHVAKGVRINWAYAPGRRRFHQSGKEYPVWK